MSILTLTEQSSAPSTPSSGEVVIYVGTDGKLKGKDDAGNITDYGGAVFGTEYNTYSSSSEVFTTSTTYSTAYTTTTSSVPAGTYRVFIHFIFKTGNSSIDGKFKIQVDGSDIGFETREEPVTTSNQKLGRVILANYTSASTSTHTIDLKYATDNSSTTVYCNGCFIEFWRVS